MKGMNKTLSSRLIPPNIRLSSARISQNLEDALTDTSVDSLMELKNLYIQAQPNCFERKNVTDSGRTVSVPMEFDVSLFMIM